MACLALFRHGCTWGGMRRPTRAEAASLNPKWSHMAETIFKACIADLDADGKTFGNGAHLQTRRGQYQGGEWKVMCTSEWDISARLPCGRIVKEPPQRSHEG